MQHKYSRSYLQPFIEHIFLVSTQQAANTQSFYLQPNDEDGNIAKIILHYIDIFPFSR